MDNTTKQYKTFLFDLDDTLLNFKESERLAFKDVIQRLDVKTPLDELFSYYQKVNEGLWRELEYGKVTKDFLKVERFKLLFENFSLKLDPQTASDYYLDALPKNVELMDGAIDLCEWLKSKGRLGIITNGIGIIQRKRLEVSNLLPYFDFIAISDDCGFSKPDIRFFEYSEKLAKGIIKEETLIIGDRYDADIVGAHNYGVDSCWINLKGETKSDSVQTYEIRKLTELKPLLEKLI
ncbi:YjjG family noncanonical pyrimidine nucleotidase [Halobacteriovorax marinus]|uniref:YjjG family noncanonical pyrimidine nucleotidase n=1 Tax=Halobacteriovorax marinus TaxID=97084 RepID=UPI003A8D17C6